MFFAFRSFPLSSLQEGIAPRLRAQLALNLQQKAKKALIWSLAACVLSGESFGKFVAGRESFHRKMQKVSDYIR
jgi:hypothetical protein